MKSSIIIALSSTIFSLSLGSPHPEAEAEPGLLKVIKTVQIWDDEEQALKDARIGEDLDINELKMEYDNVVPSQGWSEDINLGPVYDKSPQGRDLVGTYVGGRFQPASHDDHHYGHSQHKKTTKYPFALNNNGLDGFGYSSGSWDIDLNNVLVARNFTTFTNDDGLECVKKMTMTEYTEYEDITTCVHKVEERCHESYVTEFEPTQQQECDNTFEKRCSIYYEDVAVPDVVEVCKTDIAYNCDKQGPRECETIYDTVCETTRTVHTVEDDVANCKVIQEVDTACVEANKGNQVLIINWIL